MKSCEKLLKVAKSPEKWQKVAKSWKKWGKVGKSGERWQRKSLSIAFLAISGQYATFFCFQNGRPRSFWIPIFLPKSIGTSLYSMSVATSNMKLIGAFLIKLECTCFFINGCVNYEFDTCIGVAVTWNTSLGVRRRRRRRRPDQNHNIPEISNFGNIITITPALY